MASSLVNNKYRITRRIGGGSFGEIYMGIGPNNEKVSGFWRVLCGVGLPGRCRGLVWKRKGRCRRIVA